MSPRGHSQFLINLQHLKSTRNKTGNGWYCEFTHAMFHKSQINIIIIIININWGIHNNCWLTTENSGLKVTLKLLPFNKETSSEEPNEFLWNWNCNVNYIIYENCNPVKKLATSTADTVTQPLAWINWTVWLNKNWMWVQLFTFILARAYSNRKQKLWLKWYFGTMHILPLFFRWDAIGNFLTVCTASQGLALKTTLLDKKSRNEVDIIWSVDNQFLLVMFGYQRIL